MLKSLFIVSDVGSNWKRYDDPKQNKECALLHIREAAKCGVNAVKFQLFTHEELYGFPGDDTYALPREWLPDLKAECDKHKVEFMCTAFSAEGVRAVDPFVNIHKIASAEAMHGGIQDAVLATDKPFLASLGGATPDNIARLVRKYRGKEMVFLECVAAYPAKASDYNLAALVKIGALGVPIGISDHTLGNAVALTALGIGASVFEKHFMLRTTMPWEERDFPGTPDEGHSYCDIGMKNYVEQLREGFSAIGDGIKQPRESEAEFVKWAKRELGMNTFRRKKQ